MKRKIAGSELKAGVVVNYLCVAMIIVAFLIGVYGGWSAAIAIWLFISLAAGIGTFIRYYMGTGYWRFVHAPPEKLDERQVQVMNDSLRRSYAAFSVISLSYILLLTLSIRFSIGAEAPGTKVSLGMIILVGLIYLAHTLPAAIIAWTGREM